MQPITPSDLYLLKFLLGTVVSPDGSKVIYGVSNIDAAKETESAALWLLDLQSRQARRFTAVTKFDYSPCWSPDVRQIAFISSREGAPQIYLQPVDGGEAQRLTHMELGTGGGPAWSPDGKYLAFTAAAAKELPDPKLPLRITRPI